MMLDYLLSFDINHNYIELSAPLPVSTELTEGDSVI